MRKTLTILFLLLLSALLIGQAKPTPKFKPLVLTHVTVIDATGAPAKPDMSIVIVVGRISGRALLDLKDRIQVVWRRAAGWTMTFGGCWSLKGQNSGTWILPQS